MAFKVGDKVKMIIERHARNQDGQDVWGVVGVVTDLPYDGTSVERISVEFPDGTTIKGVVAGQFEKA